MEKKPSSLNAWRNLCEFVDGCSLHPDQTVKGYYLRKTGYSFKSREQIAPQVKRFSDAF